MQNINQILSAVFVCVFCFGMAEPSEEIFEILDSQGQPVGHEKRGIVHKKGLWHRSVDVLLFCPAPSGDE